MFRAFAAEQEGVGKYSAAFALYDCYDNCRRLAERPSPAAMHGWIERGLGDDADLRDVAQTADAVLPA
jgi:hypothetical protein